MYRSLNRPSTFFFRQSFVNMSETDESLKKINISNAGATILSHSEHILKYNFMFFKKKWTRVFVCLSPPTSPPRFSNPPTLHQVSQFPIPKTCFWQMAIFLKKQKKLNTRCSFQKYSSAFLSLARFNSWIFPVSFKVRIGNFKNHEFNVRRMVTPQNIWSVSP